MKLESWRISMRKELLMKLVEKRAVSKWALLMIRQLSWME